MRTFVLIAAVVLSAASASQQQGGAAAPSAPSCWHQDPFRGWSGAGSDPNVVHDVLTTYNVTFSYTPKDEMAARGFVPDTINDRLNVDGAADGNVFRVADGVVPNMIFDISISNDGNDHFQAYVTARGMGHAGTAFSENSGDATFVDPENMVNTLADRMYSWLHNGWDCTK